MKYGKVQHNIYTTSPTDMVTVQFYQLLTTPLERALPRLLEKAVSAGFRAVLTAESPERVEALNALLWSYDPASFLAHGTKEDGNPERQPIYLTTGTESPNGARLLVVTDGKWPEQPDAYERIVDIFDGNDPEALSAARSRWASYKAQSFSMAYMKQNDGGGWDKKSVA